MKSVVRIIGGEWRGRKLPVVDAEGLRPTPDRVRETLFNWLASDCRGARVLDCFAGSGVLGIEALSRGARELIAIERDRRALRNLEVQRQRFDVARIEILAGDVFTAIDRLDGSFDIVFVDPPYAGPELRARVVERLAARGCLRAGTRLYFEWPHGDAEPESPRFDWIKRRRAGQVDYGVAEWRGTG